MPASLALAARGCEPRTPASRSRNSIARSSLLLAVARMSGIARPAVVGAQLERCLLTTHIVILQ
jgi:hypothetical protein